MNANCSRTDAALLVAEGPKHLWTGGRGGAAGFIQHSCSICGGGCQWLRTAMRNLWERVGASVIDICEELTGAAVPAAVVGIHDKRRH